MESTETAHTPASLADLKPGQKLEGRVSKVELFGAFVDIGAEQQGLVHISKLRQGKINRVEDEVHEGDQVEVWVERVDPATGRLELTMIKPVSVQWKDIKPGASFKGKVVRIEKFGAFVDIGAARPGLVHVSEMRDEYDPDPNQIVSVGDEVDVTVIDLDTKKKQIRLSMKPQTLEVPLDEDEPEEALPTAMELALRQAMEGKEQDQAGANADAGGRKAKQRKEMEDILSRTLERKVNTGS
ncbi:MAG: S1 RNA-binding domain-containing protein [Anaerolineales bacterium]